MRHVTFKYQGKKYGLLCNALAIFELQDKCGGGNLFDAIANRKEIKNAEGKVIGYEPIMSKPEELKAICEYAEILSIQSANVKADLGYPRPDVFDAEKLYKQISLFEFGKLRGAIIEAINEANRQESADPNEEIDLGLLEIQKKTEKTG